MKNWIRVALLGSNIFFNMTGFSISKVETLETKQHTFRCNKHNKISGAKCRRLQTNAFITGCIDEDELKFLSERNEAPICVGRELYSWCPCEKESDRDSKVSEMNAAPICSSNDQLRGWCPCDELPGAEEL